MSGPPPFGLKRQGGKFLPEPSEVRIVQDLVESFVETGGRAKAAATALNAKGHRTRRGSAWTDTAVGRVLGNPSLKDMLPGSLWLRCQELLKQREASPGRPGRRSVHPLGGVAHCGCTGRMYLRGLGSAAKFVCKACQAKIPRDTLERLFGKSLSSVEIDASEIVAAIGNGPRAVAFGRQVGDGAISVAEVWPLLERSERCQLVDLLVSRIDVDEDSISVVFSGSSDSDSEKPQSSSNPLPSPHSFEPGRDTATREGNRLDSPDLAALLTVDEVADLLRRSSKSVYSMIERAQLPGVTRLGRRLLIRRDDLLRWLHESRASSQQERRP